MKAILVVNLVYVNVNDGEPRQNFEKNIKIPFVPYVGMDIWLEDGPPDPYLPDQIAIVTVAEPPTWNSVSKVLIIPCVDIIRRSSDPADRVTDFEDMAGLGFFRRRV